MIWENAFSIDRFKIYLIGSKTDDEICLIISDEISSYAKVFLFLTFEELHLTRLLLLVSPLGMGNHCVQKCSKLVNERGILDATLVLIPLKILIKIFRYKFLSKIPRSFTTNRFENKVPLDFLELISL